MPAVATRKKIIKRESPLSIRVPRSIGKKISNFSQAKKISKSSFIQEAVNNYIELQEWQIEGVKEAIKEMDEGKGIDGDIFLEWMSVLGTENEKPDSFLFPE